MKTTNRLLSLLFAMLLLFALSGCGKNNVSTDVSEKVNINIAALKGPTAIGMVKMMKDASNGETPDNYVFNIYGSADEISGKLVTGELDMAALPCNLAAILYNKNDKAFEVLAVNTLGVLYLLDTSNEISSVADLKGKTIYTVGKGTTPEFALNYVLTKNGLTPGVDVLIEFKSEATELAALMETGEAKLALLPEPFVSSVTAKNENIRVALDLTEEWNKVKSEDEGSLITGVLLARKEFVEANKDAVNRLLDQYAASVEYVNGNNVGAAGLVAEYNIIPQTSIAEKSIPKCNIVFMTGDEMKNAILGYLNVLNTANPSSIGGAVPNDDFYYFR